MTTVTRDCLIVHVPKFQNHYRALGNYTSTQWVALGVFGLADVLRQAGLSVSVLHLGLENALNPQFSLKDYLRSNPCRIVAFSVHFHQQIYDSLRAAETLKVADPSTFVLWGGLTASFFAHDILQRSPCVDAVIQGEGEKPLRQLVEAVRQGRKEFTGIANLLWRNGSLIAENPERYVATREDLDAIDFCNLSLMEHYREYVRMPKIFSRMRLSPGWRWSLSRLLSQKKRNIFFALPVGRGCVTNCCYCGGGVNAQRLINGRTRPVFRSRPKVMESIRQLITYGYQGAYVSFDPQPESDDYYQALFADIRQAHLAFDISFSSWGLPSDRFIEEYAKTFSSAAYIAVSPETGSERLRRVARGHYFSNEALLHALQVAEDRRVRTLVFFSLGLPGETPDDFGETLRLRDEIGKRFRLATVTAFSVEAEPAAPWSLDPDRYGITLVRRQLEDFIREQASPDYSSMSSLGYYQPTYLGKPVSGLEDYAKQVQQTRCRHFCNQRAVCAASGCFWTLAHALGMNPNGDVEI